MTWRFAGNVLNERDHELRVNGEAVPLEDTPFAVLLCLLQAEGELVTTEELLETVWGGEFVSDSALHKTIQQIRQVLGDGDNSLLSTVHGYGFRLNAAIEADGEAPQANADLALNAGGAVPGLSGWVLDERLETRPSNELWRIRSESSELGVVKLALDIRAERALKREVTLNKVLLKELGENPPLVPLTQWQFDQKPYWIRMPWFESGSLADWVKHKGGASAIPLERRVRIVAEAAEAFAKAHALGVMHKDIKPGNLLVDESGDEPRLMLCDFGSGTATSRTRLAQAGVTVMGFTQTIATEYPSGSGTASTATTGTPAYMAPELMKGGVFSERSDVYSLGVMLYQLISGEMNSPLATGWEEDIDDPGLRDIIRAASAGRPEKRIAGMHEFAQRLRAWVPGQTVTAQSPHPDGMRLSAIMFTDMVGYSSLVRADEGIARELLDHHIATMRALLPKHQGREVEIIGDAFLVEFPSAVLATQCAVAFQQAQAAYNDEAPDNHKYRIRIGIHIGDVESRKGKLFGHGVNFAARIEPLSPQGGVAISPQVLNAIEARLNLPFRSIGRKTLKNVAENIEIFALDEAAIRNPDDVRAVRRSRRWLFPLGAFTTLVVAVSVWLSLTGGNEAPLANGPEVSAPAIEQTRIALLPFDLLGLDEQAQQVMRGLQDSLAGDLAGSKDWTIVTARNLAAMNLSDAPPQKIGEALTSQRLLRGSIQQLSDTLRFNVQLIRASSGETLWGKSVQGPRADLFDLQRQVADAIALALGGLAATGTNPSQIDPAGYEAYLAALSIYRSYPWVNAEADAISTMFSQLSVAVDKAPDYIPARLLAVYAEATGYWWTWRDDNDARNAVKEHLGVLKALKVPPIQLASAEAAKAVFIDDQSAQALKLLEPYRDQLLQDADAAKFYLEALRGVGRLDDAIALGNSLVRNQPGDLTAIGRLASDYVSAVDGTAMLETGMDALRRFPQASFLPPLFSHYAYVLSDDLRFIEPGLAFPGDPQSVVRWKQRRGHATVLYRQGEFKELRRFLETEQLFADSRWYGNSYKPRAMAHAQILDLAGAPAADVRTQAQQALDALTEIRAKSDSAIKQLFAAQALALLGREQDARTLITQARTRMTPANHQLAVSNAINELALALALVGDTPALMEVLQANRGSMYESNCGYLLLDMRYAHVVQIPQAREFLKKTCTPIWQANGPGMQRYLAPAHPQASADADQRVALLPFDLLGLDDQTTQIMTGLQDALATDLSTAQEWRLVIGKNLDAMGLAQAEDPRIGEALRSGRLIRGSIQQAGEALRANMRIVSTETGETAWAETVKGSRGDLFDFQERVGQALASALGNGNLHASSRAVDPRAYEIYLKLRAELQSPDFFLSAETAQKLLSWTDQMLEYDPGFVDGHLQAINVAGGAYDSSALDLKPATARIESSLGALRALQAEPIKLAIARASAEAAKPEADAAAAWNLIKPYREQLRQSPDWADLYAGTLMASGQLELAEAEYRSVVRNQPSNLNAAAYLANFYQYSGQTAKAQATLEDALARFPDNGVLANLQVNYAFDATGDPVLLQRWVKATESFPRSGMAYLWPRLEQAFQNQDNAELLRLADLIPLNRKVTGNLTHGLIPGTLTVAKYKVAGGLPISEVRALVEQARATLADARVRSDSPARQLTEGEALAMLGKREEALDLIDQAISAFRADTDLAGAFNMRFRALPALSILDDDERIMTLLRWLEQDSKVGLGGVCVGMTQGLGYSSLQQRPGPMAWVHERCDPIIAANRKALAPYLDSIAREDSSAQKTN